MNKKIIILLVLALAIANGELAFNLQNTRYTKASDFWTVDVHFRGGSGSHGY